MKISVLAILISLITLRVTLAQNVGISDDILHSPDPSAMLDIFSNSKGMLMPNLTEVQKNAIVNPATGLIIFQTDGISGFYYNSGTPAVPVWTKLSTAASNTFSNGLTESAGAVKWGGDLLENTVITQDAAENLTFTNAGTGKFLIDLTNSGDFQIRGNSNYALFVRDDGNVGIGNQNPTYKLQVDGASAGIYKTVAYFRNTDPSADGASALFAYQAPEAGTSWGRSYLKSAIKGFTFNGYSYTAGVSGYRYDDDSPYSAGVFGAASSDPEPTVWGALGYKGFQNGILQNYAAFLSGDVGITGNVMIENEYLNFDTIIGETGYGIRDRMGTLEYKNYGGSWNPLPLPPPTGASTEWWYKPSNKFWIQPISNDNIRIYDAGQDTGFYYNGSSNKIAGFFRTTSGLAGTTAVQGFSDVAGKKTYGYLGYNGTYKAFIDVGSELNVKGSAVYGHVDDPDRVAIFGRTTGDASYSAIIGYSDTWISGYFSAKDSSGTAYGGRPALYAQLVTKDEKDAGEYQSALQAYSEFTDSGNTGYTIGGEFIALGNAQDVVGVDIFSTTDGTTNYAKNYGTYIYADDGDVVYGVYSTAGVENEATESYGIWAEANTTNGTGIVGAGNNQAPVTLATGSGAAFSGKTVGTFSSSSRSTAIGTGYTWDVTGNKAGTAGVIADSPFSGRTVANTESYQFGIIGQKTQDYSGSYYYDLRSGGVLGTSYRGDVATILGWGVLGYKSSANLDYGVYGTSSTTGAGKSQSENTGIGVAGYGDLFGSWFRGDVYGTALKGDRFSLYVDGKTYTNEPITQLNETNSEVIPTYVTTSMTADIYMKGTGKLSNGKATVVFDERISN